MSANYDEEEGAAYFNLCGRIDGDGRTWKVHHEGSFQPKELLALAVDIQKYLASCTAWYGV